MAAMVPSQYDVPEAFAQLGEGEVPDRYIRQAGVYGIIGEVVNIIVGREQDLPNVHSVTSFDAQTRFLVEKVEGMRVSALSVSQELTRDHGVAYPVPEVLTNAIANLRIQHNVPEVVLAVAPEGGAGENVA